MWVGWWPLPLAHAAMPPILLNMNLNKKKSSISTDATYQSKNFQKENCIEPYRKTVSSRIILLDTGSCQGI
jgi:hypothetical protein